MEDARILVSTTWQQRLQNEKYKNWLKVGEAMSKTCHGIRSYIEREAKAFHVALTSALHGLPLCTCVHTPSRRPNPHHDMRVCSWAKELEKYHVKGKPTWAQSDASRWNDPNVGYWEVAKLFMPYGCGKGNSCADTDATGLLNLLYWCSYYKTDRTLVEKLKDTRNVWAHTSTQELNAAETTDAFDAMKNFLQDAELTGDVDAIDALNETASLEDDDLIDFQDLEIKVVSELRRSLTSMKDEIIEKIDSIKDQDEKHSTEVRDEICQINGILNYCIKVGKERDRTLLNIQSALFDMQVQAKGEGSARKTRLGQSFKSLGQSITMLAALLFLKLPQVVPKRCIVMALLLTRLTILDESMEHIGCGERDGFYDPLDLKEIDFSEYLNQAREGFVGRQWLFKEISKSLEQEEHKGVLIIAAPGFGKSALISNLICSKLSSFSLHSQLLGYHLCIHSYKNTQNGAKFVRNLASMIMQRLQEYRYLVMKDKFIQNILKDGCSSDPSACFEQGVLAPLSELRLRFLKPMYVVVDALDECLNENEQHKGTSIVNILSHNIRRFPSWLKVIMTSRNVTNIKRKFSSLGLFEFYQDDRRNLRDIERFIISHVPYSFLSHIKSYFTSSDFSIQALVDKSQGSFLYIKLVLECLKNKGVSEASWNSLPTSINSVYQEFFERKFNTKEKFRGPRKIFEILVATLSPLKTEELYDILVANFENSEDFDFEYDFLPIVEELSVYLRNAQENQTVTVFHNSLIEWLTSKSNEGGSYYVDEKKGNRLLADYFLRKLHDKSVDISPRLIFNLATYIARGGRLKNHTEQFLELDSKLIEMTEKSTRLNALHFAASADNKNILDLLLSLFEDVDVKDCNGRTPAFYAAMSGRLDNLVLLHDKGASLSRVTNPLPSLEIPNNFFDDVRDCKRQMCEYSLLHIAAQKGHDHVVEYLLNNHVDVSLLSGTGSSAIHLAAEFGHVGTMKTLMRHGVVADNMSLYYAALRGNVNAVRFLLENGVRDSCIVCITLNSHQHPRKSYNLISYNKYKRQCNTALHAAVIGDYPDVIKLLLTAENKAVGCQNLFGKNPLHEAVHHNNYQAVNVLLKFGLNASVICKSIPANLSHYHQEACPCGYTPLHLAAHYGFSAMANLLLKHKADYNATDCEGLQPIHVASCYEHEDVVSILVVHGADVNSRGPYGMTPLHYACKCRADNVLDTLFDLGANARALSEDNKTPANFIFQDASIDQIFLLDPYVDKPIDPISFNPRGRVQAFQSTKAGNWFKFFLKFLTSSIRVSSTNVFFRKSLIASLSDTTNQNARLIIDLYSEKAFKDFFGSTWSGILEFFVYTTPAYPFYLDMVIVEPTLEKLYLNELQFSKENLLPTSFKKVFIKAFYNINCSKAIAAIEKNLVFTTDTLLDLGIDVNCEDSGLSPLLVYLRKGGSNMAKVLVKHNVTIDIQCEEYFEDSEFHLAAYHKLHYLQYLSVFRPPNKWEEYLKDENALFDYLFDEYDKVTVGEQVKLVRVRDGPVTKAIKSHSRGYKIIDECRDKENYTALHRAAQGGNVVAVKHFLKWGADERKESPEEFDILTLTIWYAVKYRPYLNLHKPSLLTSLEIEFASLTAGVILKHWIKNKKFDIGCDETKTTPTLLHLSATRGMWRFIDDLFVAKSHKNVIGLTANCPTKDNITPMYLAKLHGGDNCAWDNPWCKVVEVLSKDSKYGEKEVRPLPHIEYFLILNFLFHELPERLKIDLDKKELTMLQNYYYDDDKKCALDFTICSPEGVNQKFVDIFGHLETAMAKFVEAKMEFETFLNIEISKIRATFFFLKSNETDNSKCTKIRTQRRTFKQLTDTEKQNSMHTAKTTSQEKCSCENVFGAARSAKDRRILFLKHPLEDTCILDVCSPYKTLGFKIVDQVVQENYDVIKSYYKSLKMEMKKARRNLRKHAPSPGKFSQSVEKTLEEYKTHRDCLLKEIIYKYATLKFLLHTFKFWSTQVSQKGVLPSISKYLSNRIEDVFLNENKHRMIDLIFQLIKNHPSKYEYMKMLRFSKPPLFHRTIKPK